MQKRDPVQAVLDRLLELQSQIQQRVLDARRTRRDLASVQRSAEADTIYQIDADIEPVMVDFFERVAPELGGVVLVAEGLEDKAGEETRSRVFPDGMQEQQAKWRMILDPIDGTRGLMYDKRSAWSLAGAAINRGEQTRLAEIQVAVMTELPTSKAGYADQLWAIRGQGTTGRRVDLRDVNSTTLSASPSSARGIEHGFAQISNFFPGTKQLASELMEQIARALLGPADVHRATVFDDQYISTGGQWYELIVGHDRFNADLRPAFYQMQDLPLGLCCHPYDCAAQLIAEEAGVILTDATGQPLDGPMDTLTGMNWIGYANAELRGRIEPIVLSFLRRGH